MQMYHIKAKTSQCIFSPLPFHLYSKTNMISEPSSCFETLSTAKQTSRPHSEGSHEICNS